ncbi:S-adenosylmethionine:tRNA ribosyltransferase-isomerase [Synechococcus sp. PCC 7502]|uniref:tRNA preQ1(34) S-adenosylmethionine ribosyltransferase-isomerase QueA n=1 Tax=Synechococcus sp. PCC 7502 TaxID=1173263 RepID=UPI00029FC18C|nr:tRNA preQ1(34) S-adenosylmethionine ribosyltransferase-isomerase QueA [Synechococcus sp. PCC 7502]AFY73026.1 S-adenosylmethionine:tRNA ribosyltransferase-isomerase [Synechococcus sp. PCC 7502]
MIDSDLYLGNYNYELPSDRIAQNPVVPRDASKLMVVGASNLEHRHFYELPQLLRPHDLLVLNNTKVIPARLYGQKPNGVAVEILLIEPVGLNRWLALVKPGKRLPVGSEIRFSDRLKARVIRTDEVTKGRELLFELPPDQTFTEMLAELGEIPLPPYITNSQSTPDQYQTIYAQTQGAIAAPTAGLHFTQRLLDELINIGVAHTYITLHVGVGTFRPVEVEDITQHNLHQEWIEVSPTAIAAIQAAKAKGGRIIGVGTTTARSLETTKLQPYKGKTGLMIYPGYEWQVLDGLITNFHLPKSSLMMLVASFLNSREKLLDLYKEAIAQDYRFYSFGDAMLIWR